jgi:hypothetical protein
MKTEHKPAARRHFRAPARRPLVLATALTLLFFVLGAGAVTAVAARSHTRPVHRTFPKITGRTLKGKTLHASAGHWRDARRLSIHWQRCNAKGTTRCHAVIRKGHRPHPATGHGYTLRKADVGHRIRVVVWAHNGRHVASSRSRVTAVIKGISPAPAPKPSPPPTPTTTSTTPTPTTPTTTSTTPAKPGTDPDPKLMTLVPSSTDGSPPAGIPRSDAECAAAVTPGAEKRPENTTDNHTVPPDPSAIAWGTGWKYWPKFVADRKLVTGDFEGTTDEIIQWAACKWGLDVNEARAEAWLESGWYMSTAPGCGGPEASFGLFQIVAEDCNGNVVHGGYPYVADDTALNADYWGAWIRACFDGAFRSSQKPWQDSPAGGYNGQTMAQIIATNGENYALYGCVGAWFSNAWYSTGAQGYISTVQKDEGTKLWLQPNT